MSYDRDYDNSYRSILVNDWRCEHEFQGRPCNALLGRADHSLTIMHQVRSTHHESWTFALGALAIAKRCRKCGNVNWIFSDDVSDGDKAQTIAEFEANWS